MCECFEPILILVEGMLESRKNQLMALFFFFFCGIWQTSQWSYSPEQPESLRVKQLAAGGECAGL